MAELDDNNDKVRRNLLAAAAVVIFGTYLGIDDPVFASVLGIKLANFHPGRWWAVAIMVMGYLGLRFHLGFETASSRRKYSAIRAGEIHLLISGALTQSITTHLLRGAELKYFQNQTRVKDEFLSACKKSANHTPSSMSCTAQGIDFAGGASVIWHFPSGSPGPAAMSFDHAYRIPAWRKVTILFRAALRSLYSDAGLETVIPYAAFGISLAILMVKYLISVS